MSEGLRQLLNEQARAYICGRLGHSWRCVLPIQKRDETREVFCMCVTCCRESWIQLPPEGYERFLKDFADGKMEEVVHARAGLGN